MKSREGQTTNNSKLFKDQLITIDDLISFKTELFTEIKKLLKEAAGHPSKKWLKSHEVRKLLNISPGTLQTMRNSGVIPYTKMGGVLYYNYEEIDQMLSKKTSVNSSFNVSDSRSRQNRNDKTNG